MSLLQKQLSNPSHHTTSTVLHRWACMVWVMGRSFLLPHFGIWSQQSIKLCSRIYEGALWTFHSNLVSWSLLVMRGLHPAVWPIFLLTKSSSNGRLWYVHPHSVDLVGDVYVCCSAHQRFISFSRRYTSVLAMSNVFAMPLIVFPLFHIQNSFFFCHRQLCDFHVGLSGRAVGNC